MKHVTLHIAKSNVELIYFLNKVIINYTVCYLQRVKPIYRVKNINYKIIRLERLSEKYI